MTSSSLRARVLAFIGGALLATGCQGAPPDDDLSASEREMSTADRAAIVEKLKGVAPGLQSLFVDPDRVQSERAEFLEKYRSIEIGNPGMWGRMLRRLRLASTQTRQAEPINWRPLYEQYIDVIGANGIIDMLHSVSLQCHDEAHDLGRIIYERLKDVSHAIGVCANSCTSGCLHGVIMEAFGEGQNPTVSASPAEIASRKRAMNALCDEGWDPTDSYQRGDCAHAVGHALMFLANHDIPRAVQSCRDFDELPMMYYCVTGVYMEYVEYVDPRDAPDARTRSALYPCDESPYPAACARYKMQRVAKRYSEDGRVKGLVRECENLAGKYRLACFHGLGNAHVSRIERGRISIRDVCLHGTATEQTMCIEGAIERMAKVNEGRAREVCGELEGQNHETCLTAVKNRLYSVDKDLTLYLAD